jgi:hypothetical protein
MVGEHICIFYVVTQSSIMTLNFYDHVLYSEKMFILVGILGLKPDPGGGKSFLVMFTLWLSSGKTVGLEGHDVRGRKQGTLSIKCDLALYT